MKIISEDDLLDLIRSRPAGQAPKETKNLGGRPKKVKQKTPEPEPLGSTKSVPSSSPKKEEVKPSKVNAPVLKKEQNISSPEKNDTSKPTAAPKKSDIPPVVTKFISLFQYRFSGV